MSPNHQGLIWFLLVDSVTGLSYKGSSVDYVSLLPGSVIAQFRDAVKKKDKDDGDAAILTHSKSSQLIVYKNKSAFDKRNADQGKEEPLEEDSLLDGLGGSKKEALIVVVPKSQDNRFSSILIQREENNFDLLEKTEKAFTEKYIDPTCHGVKLTTCLLEALKSIYNQWNAEKYVAPYTSIIQSSGYGKTRLVYELPTENLVFIIYCCYRPQNESGFPLRSSLIVDKLLSVEKQFSQHVDESLPRILKFTAFHCACINVLIQELQYWHNPSEMDHSFESVLPRNKEKITLQQFCQQWRDSQINRGFENEGCVFWEAVLKQMNAILKSILEVIAKAFCKENVPPIPDISSIDDFYTSLNVIADHLKSKHLAALSIYHKTDILVKVFPIVFTTMETYMELTKKIGWTEMPLIVSVSDEARVLVKDMLANERTEFHYHRSACGLFPNFSPFVAIYMDTSARLANFQPPSDGVIPPSYRSGKGTLLFEPFYLFHTDIHSKNFSETDFLTAIFNSDLHMIHLNLFYLGRPLWGSLLKVDVDTQNDAHSTKIKVENVLGKATAKLSRLRSFDYSKLDDDVLFSLFQLRARLFIEPSSEYANTMVADYMATLLDISEDRETLRIDYPSDPAMCEAAARMMNSEKFPVERMLQVVKDHIKGGLVSGGVTGESVAKFLLLTAFDCASKDLSLLKNEIGHFTRPMTVGHFLKTLTGKQNIIDMLKDQITETKLQELMNGVVFFNHFISVDYTPQMTEMKSFFLRGAAVDCMPYQKGIDMIIPIWLKNKTSTAILVQVKNYQKSNDPLYACFCHKMTPYRCGMDSNPSTTYPYLSLYMQLGYEDVKLDTTRKLKILFTDGEDQVERSGQAIKKDKLKNSSMESTFQDQKVATTRSNKKRKADTDPSTQETAPDFSQKLFVINDETVKDKELSNEAKKNLSLSEASRVDNQVHIVLFGMNEKVYPFLKNFKEGARKQLNDLLGKKAKWIDKTKDPERVTRLLPLFRRNNNE